MSQHPVPYQSSPYPPGYDYNVLPAPLMGPARRAAALLFVLGTISLLCGVCVSTIFWVIPIEQVIAQSGVKLPDSPGVNMPQMIRVFYTVVGVLGAILGILFIVLGFAVRRGSKAAMICGIIGAVPIALAGALLGLVGIAQLGQNLGAAGFGLCGGGILFILAAALVFTLAQALRALAPAQLQQAQYMAQMWQYQQQQAAYGGYAQPPAGYGPPPPPPAPPQAPPPDVR